MLKKLPKPYDWDKCMMEMALTISKMSKDTNTKTGAILVSPDKSTISIGYNGFPILVPDYEEWWENRDNENITFIKYDLINHAEENAISQAKQSVKDWTLYVTHYPCIRCARRIVTEQLAKVYYHYDRSHLIMKTNKEDLMQLEKVKSLFSIANIEIEHLSLE